MNQWECNMGLHLHCLAKTWIYCTPYVRTERISDRRPFMHNKMFFEKTLIEVGSSHLYASFGTFCVLGNQRINSSLKNVGSDFFQIFYEDSWLKFNDNKRIFQIYIQYEVSFDYSKRITLLKIQFQWFECSTLLKMATFLISSMIHGGFDALDHLWNNAKRGGPEEAEESASTCEYHQHILNFQG